MLEISDKVGGQSVKLETLKTEVFKLKEENSAQSDQISELRAKLEANRESFEKAQAAQALVIENLTAEVRASAEKLAALYKTHSDTSKQLESLSTAVAKQGSAQPASAPSPYLRSNGSNMEGTGQASSTAPSPFLHAGDIQWSGGEKKWSGGEQQRINTSGNSTITLPIAPTAPSPLIRSIVNHAPAPIMMAAPAQSWVGGQTQTLTTSTQGWVGGQVQTLSTPSQGWVGVQAAQTLPGFGMHPQGVITYR